MMPDSAAGTTTRKATSRRVAPSPYAASRSSRGTFDIASSEIEAIVGRIITASMSDRPEAVEERDGVVRRAMG